MHWCSGNLRQRPTCLQRRMVLYSPCHLALELMLLKAKHKPDQGKLTHSPDQGDAVAAETDQVGC